MPGWPLGEGRLGYPVLSNQHDVADQGPARAVYVAKSRKASDFTGWTLKRSQSSKLSSAVKYLHNT
jgi:hypothetical protein